MSKTPAEYLVEAGLEGKDLQFAMQYVEYFEVPIVTAEIKDYDSPETAARRAKRSGPGKERAEKMMSAKRAWLAAQ